MPRTPPPPSPAPHEGRAPRFRALAHGVARAAAVLAVLLALPMATTAPVRAADDDALSTVPNDAPVLLASAHGSVLFSPDGAVLRDAENRPLLTVGDLRLAWSPPVARFGHVHPPRDGVVRVDYAIEKDDSGQVALHGLFSLRGDTLHIEYRLGAPASVQTGGAMLRRPAAPGVKRRKTVDKIGLWVRDTGRGAIVQPDYEGEAFEERADYLRGYVHAEAGRAVYEILHGHHAWNTDREQHLSFRRVDVPAASADAPSAKTAEDAPDAILDWEAHARAARASEAARAAGQGLLYFVGRAEYVLAPASRGADAVAAGRAGRAFAVTLSTDRDFHLWRSGDGDRPAFRVTVERTVLPAPEAAVLLHVCVRDFDGRAVLESTTPLDPADARKTFDHTLPDPVADGLYYVEARVAPAATAAEATEASPSEIFAQTTLAVLAPYTFRHRADSRFGMAASFAVPSREKVFALMNDTMGVQWIREGLPRDYPGMAVNHHTAYRPGAYKTPEERRASFGKTLREADERGVRYWEFGNETRVHGDDGKAAAYVDDWLRPMAEFRREHGLRTGVASIGFANGFGGVQSLRAVHEAGGWPYLDAIAYHLGRGPFTPDGMTGNPWNFLPSLLAVKRLMARYGEKPLHLTETYACTGPRDWWNDTPRLAADNVWLSYVVAYGEGVAAVHWYQLHDGVWADPGGVKNDREYHFGLLRRDGAPKAMFLAYCTASRLLDGARFRGYVRRAGTTLRGAHFDTPDGSLTFLWDRVEGSDQKPPVPGKRTEVKRPAPWVPHWTQTVAHPFDVAPVADAVPGHVDVLDVVGRRRAVAVDGGRVRIELGGSPLAVRGLAFTDDALSASLVD